MVKEIVIVLCFASLNVHAQQEQAVIAAGNELYKKQQYDGATALYEKAATLNSKNNTAYYNLGNSLYKAGKKDEAAKAYDNAATNAAPPLDKSRAMYNKGVVLTRQKKLQESIDAYKQTLRLNSRDQQARENLQLALNELKKQQSQQQPKDQPKKQDEKKDEKPQPEKNNSKLNQQQVDQMLNSLRQEEKRLQQSVQKKNNPGSSNAKDW